jgi:flagellar protein FlaG
MIMAVNGVTQGGNVNTNGMVKLPASPAVPAVPVVRQELPGSGSAPASPPANPAKAEEQVRQVVQNLSDYVQSFKRDLQFSVDRGSGRTVIRVVDSTSGETIRQIPSEELLDIARALGSGDGALLKTKA